MKNWNRREFLTTSTALGMAATLPWIGTRAAAAASEVVVGTWGGDYQNFLQQFISPAMQKQGVDVIYATGDAVPRLTKLKAEKASRRGSMDVALLGDLDMYDAYAAQALADVSDKQVPNLSQVYEQFRKPYAIPHIFSAMVLVYNTEKFKTAPDSCNVALDAAYKGRMGFSDILYDFNGIFVGLAAGGHANSYDAGKKFLMELRKNAPKVYPSNEAVAAAFKSGEIWMACMWKARALQWKDAGLPLGFVIPKEGAIPVTFEGGVAKNARNAENGYKYLNAMLAPEGQVQFARSMGYAPTVQNAKLPPDLQARVGFTDDEIKRIFKYDLQALVASKSNFLDFWNKEFKAGL
jgi:putative spermidine/putrescine transport system substrate-binding protein